MRGPSKSLPKYRKHKRSGQAIVTLSGKDLYLGPHGTKASKLEYDRLIGEWLANGRMLPQTSDQDQPIKVSHLAAAYWKHAKTYYVKNGKPTDEQAGIKIALRYVKQKYGRKPITDFGPLALEAIRNEMIKVGNSRRYINQNIGRIKRMFRWGVAKQMLPVEIYQALMTVDGLRKGKTKARETAPIMPVDDAIIDATIKKVSKVIGDMIRFQRLTGCRPGELFILRPCDVDRSSDVWEYIPESHKMEHKGRRRVILIGPKAQEVIRPYLLRDSKSFCFLDRRHRQFKRWNYHKAIKTACEKLEIEPWAPNRLRHTAATAIRESAGLEASQAVLGHSRADTTQIYAERDLRLAAKIIREVG